MYLVLLMNMAFFVGVIGVVSNPSPCFGALALVLASGFGCAVVADVGGSFSALILFLIYLGGMLVVFAYSVALSSDLYPGTLSIRFVGFFVVCCVIVVLVFVFVMLKFDGGISFGVNSFEAWYMFESGFFGISLLYSFGGCCLFVVGFGLLLTLFVVLELVRWVSFGSYKS